MGDFNIILEKNLNNSEPADNIIKQEFIINFMEYKYIP